MCYGLGKPQISSLFCMKMPVDHLMSADLLIQSLTWCSTHTHTKLLAIVLVETCEGVTCSPGKVCKMKTGRPQCVCSPDCSHISLMNAVCGSDGKTYKDECALLMARCMGHPDLEVMYQGECKSKHNFYIYLVCQISALRCFAQKRNNVFLFY